MGMQQTVIQIPTQLLEQAKKGQDAALVAIRQIVDSVDSAVPDIAPKALEGRVPDRKDLINQAFDATERALNAGHGIATIVTTTVVSTAGNVLSVDADADADTAEEESEKPKPASKKTASKKS